MIQRTQSLDIGLDRRPDVPVPDSSGRRPRPLPRSTAAACCSVLSRDERGTLGRHGEEAGDARDGAVSPDQLVYTPEQSARRLTIPESWLRREAGERKIPCTFLGKHLRFSEADLRAIVVQHATAPGTRRKSRR
ncbi:helix-turn-helix domain-containing protein [Amycolatopsis circi]|uniref:helix-turn-helix domain-containing protein n=1 Tax=Amycolatopsis circi TaxID=871959 RepID=UPI001ABF0BAC|nr:helix-turn-helix domain-containing protein [Amycolatopsis circi]